MRNYQILDVATIDEDNILSLTNSQEDINQPSFTMSREGAFIGSSTSIGPLEVAIRFRYQDFTRRLSHLHPVPGLAVTRQVGSANSYLSLGLTQDEKLVLRPTIVADAGGHISFNLVCTAEVRQAILNWLEIE